MFYQRQYHTNITTLHNTHLSSLSHIINGTHHHLTMSSYHHHHIISPYHITIPHHHTHPCLLPDEYCRPPRRGDEDDHRGHPEDHEALHGVQRTCLCGEDGDRLTECDAEEEADTERHPRFAARSRRTQLTRSHTAVCAAERRGIALLCGGECAHTAETQHSFTTHGQDRRRRQTMAASNTQTHTKKFHKKRH